MADDVSPQSYGCYGNSQARTTNIDRMARGGILFETAWATPICTPTRVMLMTGRYARRTGWYHNGLFLPLGGEMDFTLENLTFLQLLKDHGYATALAGKWQLPSPLSETRQGIDMHCVWAPGKRHLPEGAVFAGAMEDDVTHSRFWHPAMVRDGELLETKADDFGPDIAADALIGFIRANRGRPFCAYFPMLLPHATRRGWTSTPAQGRVGDLVNGTLQAGVDYTDLLVGRILKELVNLGIRDRTVVIFTSDNGGLPNKNSATDLGARVPLVVDCPGVVARRGATPELASLADILPTLGDLAGAKLPDGYELDGKSMASFLRGDTDRHRDWLFSYIGTARMLRDQRWLLEAVDAFRGSPNGRFYDLGRGEPRDVTDSGEAEVLAARRRFDAILRTLPAPDADEPGIRSALEKYYQYKFRHKLQPGRGLRWPPAASASKTAGDATRR